MRIDRGCGLPAEVCALSWPEAKTRHRHRHRHWLSGGLPMRLPERTDHR